MSDFYGGECIVWATWYPDRLFVFRYIYLGTFYEKARIASQYPGVEYVIVYNSEKDQPLVPMASDYDTDMRLLFVSYETGSGECLWYVNFIHVS